MPSSWRSRRRLVSNSANTPSMSQERLARGRAGVHGLLGRAQGDAATPQLVDDVLEVLQRAGEPVDARDHQRVAGLHELEQHLQLGPAVTSRTAGRLGADHATAGGAQRPVLEGEVLVEGTDTS